MTSRSKKNFALMAGALVFGVSFSAFAQDPNYQPPSSGGWRKFSQNSQPPAPDPSSTPAPMPQQTDQGQPPVGPPPRQIPPTPPTLTLAPGTWITIRVDQPLASNHNQPGDSFTGTLMQPVVADGRVIARRGQMVAGRVTESVTAKRAGGQSRLGIEVTELSLVDGRQLPVKTQWMERRGSSSTGDNVATVGATTGIGAAIGAAADGGFGAGMGAIAGAGASLIGVLLANGKPAVLYPETPLTFRVEAPAQISTERAEYAFEPVSRDDYATNSPSLRQGPPRFGGQPPAYYGSPYGAPYAYPYPGPYAYPYYGYGYSPLGFGVYVGPRFYYGRGFYRHW